MDILLIFMKFGVFIRIKYFESKCIHLNPVRFYLLHLKYLQLHIKFNLEVGPFLLH